MNKYYKELKKGIKPLFDKKSLYKCSTSKLVEVGFMLIPKGEDKEAISIFIPEGIDNCYNEKYDWRWEIYLYEDGTWKIV